MSAYQDPNRRERLGRRALDWPRLVERAAESVLQALAVSGELRPHEVAELVAASLPASVGRWLRQRLAALGWSDPDARIAFNVLDSPRCPPDLRGGRREIVRLAVFGVPGEGVRSDAKRREAIYQQRCAEIMREMRDLESLSYAAARALGHPEVHGDPVLFAMLRSFIAEREAELRARAHLPGAAEEDEAAAGPAVEKPKDFKVPLRERVQAALSRLRLELEGHLTHYNEVGAQEVLARIKDMHHRYPGHVERTVVDRCETQVKRLTEQRDSFRNQLTELVEQAVAAAQGGDLKTASWVSRRLSAIHTLLPAVLSRERYEGLRDAIAQSMEKHERHEAARQLVAREQAVGAEVKRLGAIIHRYHKLMHKTPSDDAVMRHAAREYRRAVEEVRSHDDEWLADLMIELDCLLDDLRGPRERAEAQVDQFVSNVRTALHQMQTEIEVIQKERAASADSN